MAFISGKCAFSRCPELTKKKHKHVVFVMCQVFFVFWDYQYAVCVTRHWNPLDDERMMCPCVDKLCSLWSLLHSCSVDSMFQPFAHNMFSLPHWHWDWRRLSADNTTNVIVQSMKMLGIAVFACMSSSRDGRTHMSHVGETTCWHDLSYSRCCWLIRLYNFKNHSD